LNVEHSPIAAVHADFIRSPLGIAVLMLVSSVGGGWLKDRLLTEHRDTATEARIEALQQRIGAEQAETDMRLSDIRQDIRDLKFQIDDRTRALALDGARK
jgi:selenocysteine lyase/cysteine desulfurase